MKYLLVTLGCKVNAYESSLVGEMLIERGLTYDKDNTDLIVINTCAVTTMSEHKSRQMLHRYHEKFPHAIIAVMGCYAQRDYKRLEKDDSVNIVVGTSNRHIIPDLFSEYLQTGKKCMAVEPATRQFSYEHFDVFSTPLISRAYLKIQDGCDMFCHYCIIPFLRGKSRSRAREDILSEVHSLVKRGFSEIILTGIDMASYRDDSKNDNYDFVALLQDILSILPKQFRLRLSSLECHAVDDRFLDLLKDERIVDHLHIPLQSGSNAVLKAMNRHYDTDFYFNKINAVRQRRPNIAITSDVMVGYYNEGEKEFKETYAFIERCAFSELHVFPYSMRPNTAASYKGDLVTANIKKQRVKALLDLSTSMHETYAKKFLGKPLEVLVEEYDDKTKCFCGHTANYLYVSFKSNQDLHRGDLVNVIYDKIE